MSLLKFVKASLVRSQVEFQRLALERDARPHYRKCFLANRDRYQIGAFLIQ
jgi:hypothetical protein